MLNNSFRIEFCFNATAVVANVKPYVTLADTTIGC